MSPLFDVLRRWPEGFSSALPEGPWVHDAIRHGVAPFVADSLALGGQRVPIELVNAARGQLTTGRRHRAFTLDVIDALASDGVTPTLLKGYGLATRLYATPLSRPSVDVDLAIAPRSMPVAEQAMARLGLSLQADSALDDELEEHHHRAWAGPRGLVELHHRLASGLGGEGLDVGDGGSRDHFGTAHRIFLGGDFALLGCEGDTPAALAPALECLAGLHGSFEAPHSLHASRAEEVFNGNVQRGIGSKAGLFDQGLGGTFAVTLRDESGIQFHRSSERGG